MPPRHLAVCWLLLLVALSQPHLPWTQPAASQGALAAQLMEFAWGFGGSAYQIEGAWNEDGKGLSTFDVWSHSNPSRIGQPNGDVSADHYHRMKSDLAYLGQLKATAYRFSISWPRILPNCTGPVNPKGVQFYSDMIDEILKQGAEPFLTMFHWDLPQACMDQFGGFTSEKIIDAFTEFADVLYANYGDRVRYWLTINEPRAHCDFCYATTFFAPGLNLGEPFIFTCMHYSHIIHGTVVQLAREKYKTLGSEQWEFGMPSIVEWYAPDGSNPFLSVQSGWFYSPCYIGDYPDDTKAYFGSKLPVFTEAQKSIMKNTCTYLALNYYSGIGVEATQPSGKSWQNVYPEGARRLANWMYRKFQSPIIFTETGYSAPDEVNMTRQEVIDDTQGWRLKYWMETVSNVTAAASVDKVPVKGMLAWALLDNLEWVRFSDRFGCIGVDFNNGTLDRYVKASTFYMSQYFSQYDNPFAVGQRRPSSGSSSGDGGDNSGNAGSNGVNVSETVGGGDGGGGRGQSVSSVGRRMGGMGGIMGGIMGGSGGSGVMLMVLLIVIIVIVS